MRNPFRKPTPITRQLVAASDQLAVTRDLFGVPFRLDRIARGFVMTMTTEYHRSPWQLYVLNNGGCYSAPVTEQVYHLIGETRPLSADAMGLVSSLLSLSYLSHSMNLRWAESFDSVCLAVSEFIHQHTESASILEAAGWLQTDSLCP